MLDFYFLIHYVLYRYYSKQGERPFMALVYACSIQGCLSIGFLICVEFFVSHIFNWESLILSNYRIFVFGYAILFYSFEYFIFCRNELYLEVFDEFSRESDSPVMQKKFKQAKIFNWSILIMFIIMLCIIDYMNHHKP